MTGDEMVTSDVLVFNPVLRMFKRADALFCEALDQVITCFFPLIVSQVADCRLDCRPR